MPHSCRTGTRDEGRRSARCGVAPGGTRPPGGCAPGHPPARAGSAPGTPTRHRQRRLAGRGRYPSAPYGTILSSAPLQPSTQTAAPADPAGAICWCRALVLAGLLAPLGHERIHVGNLVLVPIALTDPVDDLEQHLRPVPPVVEVIHR